MKTIEITSGSQKAQFTTKSVTFDGKEFFYAHMSNVINSTEKHVYTFTYEGEVHFLPYEEKDAKTLNAIFSQVQKMAAQKKTAEEASRNAQPKDEQVQTAEDAVPQEKRPVAAPNAATSTDTDADKGQAKEPAEMQSPAETAPVRVTDVLGGTSAKSSADADSKKTTAAATDKEDGAAEKPDVDPETKKRRKKSLIIFGIIIAAVLVCSVAYYFIFGTPSDPAPANPNAPQEQQYDDIDQLIDDLQ